MATPTARLEVVAGRAAGTWILVEDVLLIGRHAEGLGRLAEDDEISRLHARLTLDGDGVCAVEDLGSTNGTFVNGLRLSAPQIVSEGDTIEVGGTTLMVRELRSATEDEDEVPPADSRPQPTSVSVQVPAIDPPLAAGSTRLEETAPMPPPVQADPVDAPAAVDTPLMDETGQAMPSPLAFRVEIDFGQLTAQILLDDTAEPVRLVFTGGAWRMEAARD